MSYIGKVSVDGGTTTNLVGSTLYGTCATGASTAQKVVTLDDCDKTGTPETGLTVHVKFSNSNTSSSPTLKVGSFDAKNLCRYGTTRAGTTAATSWTAGAVVSFTFDGTSWVMNDFIADTDTNTTDTAGSSNSTAKLFLVGTASQGTAGTGVTSYSNSSVYAENGALHATTFNGYTLGAASEKSVGSVASGSTGLVTGGDVYSAIQSAAAGSMKYGGVVTSEAALGTDYTAGTYWIVGNVSAGTTIGGETVEAGDMIIAHAAYSGTVADDVDVVQSNLEKLTDSDIDSAISEAEAA